MAQTLSPSFISLSPLLRLTPGLMRGQPPCLVLSHLKTLFSLDLSLVSCSGGPEVAYDNGEIFNAYCF